MFTKCYFKQGKKNNEQNNGIASIPWPHLDMDLKISYYI